LTWPSCKKTRVAFEVKDASISRQTHIEIEYSINLNFSHQLGYVVVNGLIKEHRICCAAVLVCYKGLDLSSFAKYACAYVFALDEILNDNWTIKDRRDPLSGALPVERNKSEAAIHI
jgi:hypothetical protein